MSTVSESNTNQAEIYTIQDYILERVKFEVPENALRPILLERDVDADVAASDVDKNVRRLIYADLLKWMVLGPSKVNNTSDTDNGWSHSAGGHQLTTEDIKELKFEANAIYKELEPESVFGKRVTFVINSGGVKPANKDIDGAKLPHIILR